MDKNYNKSAYREYIELGQPEKAEQYLKDLERGHKEWKEYKAEMKALGTPVSEGPQSVSDIAKHMMWSMKRNNILGRKQQ